LGGGSMFKKILVPVDIDYPRTAALVYTKAAQIADLSGAEIRLISVMPGFSMPLVASYISAETIQKAKENLETTLQAFIREHCRETVSYTIASGKNWEEIVKAADEWEADLVVVYHNRRREINEVFSRSCSQRVSENANCSVLRLRNIRA